jgi:ATP dependent DNA ligase domain
MICTRCFISGIDSSQLHAINVSETVPTGGAVLHNLLPLGSQIMLWFSRSVIAFEALSDSGSHITDCATEELKLDGYRALAIKARGQVRLRSRNDKDFTSRYSTIAEALRPMPDDTIVDGEIVAFDASGRPSFNMLQNFGSSSVPFTFMLSICQCWRAGTSPRCRSIISAANCFGLRCCPNWPIRSGFHRRSTQRLTS